MEIEKKSAERKDVGKKAQELGKKELERVQGGVPTEAERRAARSPSRKASVHTWE